MRVLDRKMFATGDVAKKSRVIPKFPNDTMPLTDFQIQTGQTVSRLAKPRGLDPEFDSFLDRYGITDKQYAEVHGLIEPGSGMATPFMPELFFGPGGLQSILRNLVTKKAVPTGASGSVPLPAGQAGPAQVIPITKETTTLTPLGKTLLFPSTLALTGSAAPPKSEDQVTDKNDIDLIPASDLDVDLSLSPDTQKALDEIMGTKKVDQNQDLKDQAKTEIEFLDQQLKNLNDAKLAAAADIKRKQDLKDFSTSNIFLEEISLALAENEGDLGFGLAEGAANAAKRLGEEEREDKLALLDALGDLEEGGLDLTESNVLTISERYRDAESNIRKQQGLKSILDNMKKAIEGGNATGAQGAIARFLDALSGISGIGDRTISAAQKTADEGEFIQAQAIQAILSETGRTISDRDRELVRRLIADITNPVVGQARALQSLQRVLATTLRSEEASKNEIKFLKERYSQAIPELSQYTDTNKVDTTSSEQEYNLEDTIPG